MVGAAVKDKVFKNKNINKNISKTRTFWRIALS